MPRRMLARLSASLLAITVLVSALAAPTLAQGRSFLWKATRGPGVVYLVGSLHLLTKDYYPLAPALEAAHIEGSNRSPGVVVLAIWRL